MLGIIHGCLPSATCVRRTVTIHTIPTLGAFLRRLLLKKCHRLANFTTTIACYLARARACAERQGLLSFPTTRHPQLPCQACCRQRPYLVSCHRCQRQGLGPPLGPRGATTVWASQSSGIVGIFPVSVPIATLLVPPAGCPINSLRRRKT